MHSTGVDFDVEPGRIVGLIGPNGAGKTTALKAILGLIPFEGELEVMGKNPYTERDALMRDVCFIADVAVLPRWLRVRHALDFVAGVHPRFNRERAEEFLRKTDIRRESRVRELSKGMVTQLHLALILAIDARLLVLDEPTLGLDLLFRRQFYDTLVNDYFDKERTILVTTHQVEEIENLLTDVMFIQRGRIVARTARWRIWPRATCSSSPPSSRRVPRASCSPSTSARSSAASCSSLKAAGARSSSPTVRSRTPSDRGPVCRDDAGRGRMNTSPMITLIRREFWEHRMLWMRAARRRRAAGARRAVAALRHAGRCAARTTRRRSTREYYVMFHGIAHGRPQFAAAEIMLPFYLLDCLYTERRDRSILFWKSLPVSDAQTVLAKVLVALVVVPLGAFVLGAATDIAASTILVDAPARRADDRHVPALGHARVAADAGSSCSRRSSALLAWYAPVGAYLLVVSAWAKRSAFLWVVVPPLWPCSSSGCCSGLGYVTRFLGYRLSSARALSYPYQSRGVEPTVGGTPGHVRFGAAALGVRQYRHVARTASRRRRSSIWRFASAAIRARTDAAPIEQRYHPCLIDWCRCIA